jgi:hypothetical protein
MSFHGGSFFFAFGWWGRLFCSVVQVLIKGQNPDWIVDVFPLFPGAFFV